MTSLLRVKTRWSGFVGSPGYTVMHFRDFGTDPESSTAQTTENAAAAVARVRTFFSALATVLPSSVTVVPESEVDVIEHTNGELVESYAVTAGAPIVGTATNNFSAPVGAVVNWRTGTIRNGRRLRGRTFLVPLSTTAFGTSGILNPGANTTIGNAALALAGGTTGPRLFVYGRPSNADATDGAFGIVTSSNVPTMSAVLRSRRD